jgi:methionyl-tRNA formyltransferase
LHQHPRFALAALAWRRADPASDRRRRCKAVTIMQMEAGLDTGPMLLTRAVSIDGARAAASRTRSTCNTGCRALLEAPIKSPSGTAQPPQPADGA